MSLRQRLLQLALHNVHDTHADACKSTTVSELAHFGFSIRMPDGSVSSMAFSPLAYHTTQPVAAHAAAAQPRAAGLPSQQPGLHAVPLWRQQFPPGESVLKEMVRCCRDVKELHSRLPLHRT